MIFKFDEPKAGKDVYESLIITNIAITGDLEEIRAYVSETKSSDFFFKTIPNIFDSYQGGGFHGANLCQKKNDKLSKQN